LTIEEAVDVLYGFRGQMVEVSVSLRSEVGGEQFFSSFSGVADEVHERNAQAGDEHWTLGFVKEGNKPHNGSVTIWRNGFEDAEFEEPERLTVRHRGVTIELYAYI
jgi:hypothetical protein